MATIAFDTATGRQLASGASSLTYSHTCTGSNLILFVGVTIVNGGNNDQLSSVTYNGTSMTLVKKVQGSSGLWDYLYMLVGPATGAHNVVVTCSASQSFILSYSASYSGAKQSGQVDSSNTGTVASGATITVSTTVLQSNCWLIMYGESNGNPYSSGTVTYRATPDAQAIGDSNGTVPTGSQSLSMTQTNATAAHGGIIASFLATDSALASAGGSFLLNFV